MVRRAIFHRHDQGDPSLGIRNASTLGRLVAQLELLAGGPLPQWQEVLATAEERRYRQGEAVFTYGSRHPYAHLVARGLVKIVVTAPNGKPASPGSCQKGPSSPRSRACVSDLIRRLDDAGSSRAVMDADLARAGQSRSSAIAIEPTVAVQVDLRQVELMAHRHVAWAMLLANVYFLQALRNSTEAMQMRALSAEERYLAMRAQDAQLVARVSQRDLAQHLGVTEVGLSRIISRLRAANLLDGDPDDLDDDPEAEAKEREPANG